MSDIKEYFNLCLNEIREDDYFDELTEDKVFYLAWDETCVHFGLIDEQLLKQLYGDKN